MKRSFCLGIMMILFMALIPPAFSSSPQTTTLPHPKNVIIMIGDGMGYNCIKAADFYFGPSSFSQFPVQTAVATFYAGSSYDPKKAWNKPSYLKKGFTESAAAATALATGYKTALHRVGISASGDTLLNLTEFAKSTGRSAGVITTVPISHATPAGFTAHNSSRTHYSQIARDILFRSCCDLVMGCGNPEFDYDGLPAGGHWKNTSYVVDSLTWLALKDGSGKTTVFTVDGAREEVADVNGDHIPDPWTVITSRQDILKLAHGTAPRRVLACPEVNSTLQEGRTMGAGETKDTPPFLSPVNPRIPTLAEMVMGGLNVLDSNPSGFFLMIEGGAIDWANHDNLKGRMLEEMKGFRDAVDSVINWVETHSSWDETLLIITADHESGFLWGGKPFAPVLDNGQGRLPSMQYNSGDHTNSLVALYAKGSGASLLPEYADEKDPVRGPYIQNVEIPRLIFRLWSDK